MVVGTTQAGQSPHYPDSGLPETVNPVGSLRQSFYQRVVIGW